jgi:hypothetical protein
MCNFLAVTAPSGLQLDQNGKKNPCQFRILEINAGSVIIIIGVVVVIIINSI